MVRVDQQMPTFDKCLCLQCNYVWEVYFHEEENFEG